MPENGGFQPDKFRGELVDRKHTATIRLRYECLGDGAKQQQQFSQSPKDRKNKGIAEVEGHEHFGNTFMTLSYFVRSEKNKNFQT